MANYLLSIIQPQGEPPAPAALAAIMKNIDAVNEEIKAAGAWVFSGGLHNPGTATLLRVQNGDLLMTDGPFTEGSEHIGGLYVIEAADLDEALAWGRKVAMAVTLPIEVRPFQQRR